MRFNEYDQLTSVAIRTAANAFATEERIARDWQPLRFHEKPDLQNAIREYDAFKQLLVDHGAEIIALDAHDSLTLDSIYPRDSLLVTPTGLVLCRMGRHSRQNEPALNAGELSLRLNLDVIGEIAGPGTIEGGDLIWLDESALAVGLGPRTNQSGVDQLQAILGSTVEIHTVTLPAPNHPEDVFHLMSMISPLDKDLALIYRPLMPDSFLDWLQLRGIQFVEVPEEEFLPMGCNVLATAPRRVIMLDRLPLTKARLEAAGCEVSTFTGDEISRKGEGGPTCLTRPLVRGA